jgi:UDP-N-acetylmuramyl pentapeptide phosphotransferase/UDP-N-acetylglucosamine-1-phosphate transferase
VFVMVATVNSANLLDGLDGLLSGCALIDFITLALILMLMAASGAPQQGNLQNLMLFCGATAGALLGFLRFNSYPAGVFMGDVGSFAIGGALVAVTTADAAVAADSDHRAGDGHVQPVGHHSGRLLQGDPRQARVQDGAAAPPL